MKRLAYKAGLPENVLVTFVLNGLPDDIGGFILMNVQGTLTWEYIYKACEGLDCSKRANEDDNIQLKQQVGMDICSIKEERICNYCKKEGHIIKDCKKLKWKNTQQSRNVDVNENFEDVGKTDMNKSVGFYSNHVSVSDRNELKLKIRIANNDILALLDTGSTVNLVNSKYASNIEKVKGINLKSANGTTMKVLGKTT
ncbi:hypothetical protein NGRA_3256 [Nosema granulosis]|uniref:CCHC-type domain-containing protein n=1 Tax=Nosema granulosis TaxID=83296 RepID=A0A9P6GVK8_9MICR|nr:hypothetical protein NGRA_3256 [Nosema granulosis]